MREGLHETKVPIFTLILAILFLRDRRHALLLERAKAHSTACGSPGFPKPKPDDENCFLTIRQTNLIRIAPAAVIWCGLIVGGSLFDGTKPGQAPRSSEPVPD